MKNNKKVLIGLSGGVDSTVSAYLLQKDGYEVEGLYLKLHKNDKYHENNLKNVKKVTDYLGIKYHILDLQSEFKKKVYDKFLNTYIDGKTPNPCIICNKEIKFGKMAEFAKSINADFLATGHYVKTDGKFLYCAEDKTKDQSYFLSNIDKNILDYLIFPLGKMLKTDVKNIAKSIEPLREIGESKESQDICFIDNDTNYLDLLKDIINIDRVGDIIDLDGNIIGTHRGYMHYTVGQRKGFDVPLAHHPHYVLKIIPEKNQIIAGLKDTLKSIKVTIQNENFFIDDLEFTASVKLRYSKYGHSCKVKRFENYSEIYLNVPEFAVALGQGAVFYDDEKVLGGGTISKI